MSAEKGNEKIAVEIQSFLSDSAMYDFHRAVGQFLVYRSVLRYHRLEHRLHMAIPLDAYELIWTELIGRIVREDQQIHLIVYNDWAPGVLKWIAPSSIERF